MLRDYELQLHGNKLDNLKETDKCLDTDHLPRRRSQDRPAPTQGSESAVRILPKRKSPGPDAPGYEWRPCLLGFECLVFWWKCPFLSPVMSQDSLLHEGALQSQPRERTVMPEALSPLQSGPAHGPLPVGVSHVLGRHLEAFLCHITSMGTRLGDSSLKGGSCKANSHLQLSLDNLDYHTLARVG